MEIVNYKSLKEKENFFISETIETKNEFNDFIDQYKDKNNTIFRGQSEAKYKLYNAAQRFWLNNHNIRLKGDYFTFIHNQISNAKAYQDGLLIKHFNSFGHKLNDFSILSFLQHYGAPTPFLDFTYNLDCALFFASETRLSDKKKDIENYFSVYAIETKPEDLEFKSIIDLFISATEVIENEITKYPEKNIEKSSVADSIENFSFKSVQDLDIFYIPGYSENGYKLKIKQMPTFNPVFNQQNLNVINQQGLFVYSSSSEFSLEEYFSGSEPNFHSLYLPKIKCWNIHKSLKDIIIKYLNSLKPYPIDRDYLYPKEENIAKYAIESIS